MQIDEIKTQLDEFLEVEFSFYQTDELARSIAQLSNDDGKFVMQWVQRTSAVNIELAYRFARKAYLALTHLGYELTGLWLISAMDKYDEFGLRQAIETMDDMNGFIKYGRQRQYAVFTCDHKGILERFLHGLSGRKLRLEISEKPYAYTDTQSIFLPKIAAKYDTKDKNFKYLKFMLVLTWAQVRFQTFVTEIEPKLAQYADTQKAKQWFVCIEHARLMGKVKCYLPGVYRDGQVLNLIGSNFDFGTNPTVFDALLLVWQHYPDTPPNKDGFSDFDWQAVRQTKSQRIEKEKALLKIALKDCLDEHNGASDFSVQRGDTNLSDTADDANTQDLSSGDDLQMQLFLDDLPVESPETVADLLQSVVLDFGDIPSEYLHPAGDDEYNLNQFKSSVADDVWSGTYHEDGAFLYHEWDYKRQHFRKNWCVVREIEAECGSGDFYQQTLEKYHHYIQQLRKNFERLRGEHKWLNAQVSGDEIDLDALADSWVDWVKGGQLSEKIYSQKLKEDRNIAVMFMVDMSGSTKGWINDCERESLVLMVEALEILSDRYAIYGFSGWSRKRCEVYRIKDFAQQLSSQVRQKICQIAPKDYTRMGAAIRHLSQKLCGVDASVKLLITISDGKPDDYGMAYRGQYGIEDTRMALQESKRNGINAYCITIDKSGRDYLPYMYGVANFTILDAVEQLPFKLSDVYRKLTS